MLKIVWLVFCEHSVVLVFPQTSTTFPSTPGPVITLNMLYCRWNCASIQTNEMDADARASSCGE